MIRRFCLCVLCALGFAAGLRAMDNDTSHETATTDSATHTGDLPGSRGSGFTGIHDGDGSCTDNTSTTASSSMRGDATVDVDPGQAANFLRERNLAIRTVYVGDHPVRITDNSLHYRESPVSLQNGFFSELRRYALENTVRGVGSAPVTVMASFWQTIGSTLGQTCAGYLILKIMHLFGHTSVEDDPQFQFAVQMRKALAADQIHLMQEGVTVENLRKQIKSFTARTPQQQAIKQRLESMYNELVMQHALQVTDFMLAPQMLVPSEQDAKKKAAGQHGQMTGTDARALVTQSKKTLEDAPKTDATKPRLCEPNL